MNNFFEILRPGINTTFQDRGRFNLQHFGVTASGCMDNMSFVTANSLVSNNKNEGVSIEIKDDNNETIVVPSSLQGKTQLISKPQNVVFNEARPSWFR